MRKLLFLIIVVFTSNVNAQVVYGNPGWGKLFEKPEKTERDYKKADDNVAYAQEAFNEGDMKKTRYYLKASEKKGIVSKEFYLLLGKYNYKKGKSGLAGRYWLRGYRKYACWECGELRDEMLLKRRREWDAKKQ